jgi:hypothetical protein
MLTRAGGTHFLVDRGSDTPAAVEARAARDGSRVLANTRATTPPSANSWPPARPTWGGEG